MRNEMPYGKVLFSKRHAEPILRIKGVLVQKKKNFRIVLISRDTGTALHADAEGGNSQNSLRIQVIGVWNEETGEKKEDTRYDCVFQKKQGTGTFPVPSGEAGLIHFPKKN
jgi:hypothetical protein